MTLTGVLPAFHTGVVVGFLARPHSFSPHFLLPDDEEHVFMNEGWEDVDIIVCLMIGYHVGFHLN